MTRVAFRLAPSTLAAALVLFASGPAHAVLGESEQELIARYGQPSERRNAKEINADLFDTVMVWKKEHLRIFAWLIDGRSVAEDYELARNISGFDDPVAKVFLDANGGADIWISNAGVVTLYNMKEEAAGMDTKAKYAWLRKNANMAHYAAVYEDTPSNLTVRSPAFYRAREAFLAEAAK